VRTVRLLIPLVLRALGVTLLMLTVLLPAADHHALARLALDPEAGALDIHALLIHHHPLGHRSAPRPADAPTAFSDWGALSAPTPASPQSAIAPAMPAYEAVFGGAPVLDAVALAAVIAAGAWLLRRGRLVVPLSRALRVPSPPPRRLLSAA
jgi:hypothetical protein